MNNKLLLLSISLMALTGFAQGPEGEELARRQARSVHLAYSMPADRIESAEASVIVTQSQTNSYFMVLGWSCGYCGIQDLGPNRIFIFSVWDPGDPFNFKARPDDVKEELRAKVLYSDPDVYVSRFGGEGTGAKTMMKLNWKENSPVRVRIDSKSEGTNRTAFTCTLISKSGKEKVIAQISTLNRGDHRTYLGDLHSFVEDFWRNYHSATLIRRAEFAEVKVRREGSTEWLPVRRARFSADGTPAWTIDAGKGNRARSFFLQTGGATQNKTTKLWDYITLPE